MQKVVVIIRQFERLKDGRSIDWHTKKNKKGLSTVVVLAHEISDVLEDQSVHDLAPSSRSNKTAITI